LVGMALPLQQNFMAIALPGLIAAIAVSLIDHRRSASAHHQDVTSNLAHPIPEAARP
jgi:MFS transporter, AAHS family, benzoate transport protein